jgi:3-oxoacyl-[acyl-carrier protein] reductase
MRLKDKVALITGSSRGIGRATALLFAREGAKIIVNYNHSENEANSLVKQIKALSDAIAIKCDVSDEKEVKGMISRSIKAFGKIDILVNNAGIVFDKPLAERSLDDWKKTLEVNLIGSFLCAKYAAPYLKKHGKGKIINVSSTNAINGFNPESIDYDASKAGMLIMTRDLAQAYAPDIRVNAVAPGWVNTDINKNLPKEYVKEETEKIYLKRFAEPQEIANAILFLASEESSFITGSILKIDGGYG